MPSASSPVSIALPHEGEDDPVEHVGAFPVCRVASLVDDHDASTSNAGREQREDGRRCVEISAPGDEERRDPDRLE